MEYQLIESLLSPEKKSELSVIEQVLTNRGIALKDVPHYLNTTDEDILDPSLIANIHQGAQMLVKHISNNDKIFIQVDSDCDGFTSAAALINYLNMIFPGFVQNNIFYRIHDMKKHGLVLSAIPEDIKLVIAPDSSSNDYDKHKQLFERGCDVLVIDHHKADKISEYACVINNQLCDYPTKSLSGVGMVYKFCCYLDKIMGINNADNILDLVAVGMIADMMDLKDFETKHLIFKGLQKFHNPFLIKLKEAQNYSINKGGGINPHTIGFFIAPAINATIRVGTPEEKRLLFEAMLDYMAYEMIPSTKRGCKSQLEPRVVQACRNCNNIKNRQTKMRDAGIALIQRKIEREGLDQNKIILIQSNEYEINPNLTGLIANKIMAEYKHPTLLLLQKPDEETGEILLEGSGRGYTFTGFNNLRQFLKDSGHVYLAEGHPQALGVGMLSSEVDSFIADSNEILKDCDFNPSYKVDFIWNANDFTSQDIIDLAALNGICGQGVEQPYIAIEDLRINKDNLTLLSRDKSPTLKITLPNGVSLIKFGFDVEEYDSLIEACENKDLLINVVGTAAINEWNGRITGQVQIEDYNICTYKDWLSYF